MDYTSLTASSFIKHNNLPSVYKKWALEVIEDMQKAIESKSKNKGDKDFYHKLGYKIEKNSVIIEFPEYGKWIEWGRGANKTPPPIKALIPWMNRHGIDKTAVWAISKSIGKEGIKPRPFMGIFDKKIPELSDMVAQELENEIDV